MPECFTERSAIPSARSPRPATPARLKRDVAVHIVEADRASANALTALFTLEGFSTSVFQSTAEFFANFNQSIPDAVIANLSINSESGLEIPLRLRAKNVLVPVFMLNDSPAHNDSSKAMMLGAYDVIKKPYDAQHLVDLVTRTIQFDLRRHVLARKASIPALAALTQRELQIVELIVSGDSSKEVAQKLGISFRTVEVHRSSAMMKLRARNSADLVRIVLTS